MALVPMKCTQCGAALKIDDSFETAVCEYCHMAFIIERERTTQVNAAEASDKKEEKEEEKEEKEEKEPFEIVNGVLLKYHGSDTEIKIPEEVVEIANGAFYKNKEIISVVIPNGVVAIGQNGLLKLASFGECKSLRKINIPDSIHTFPQYSFMGCINLTDVDISIEQLFALPPFLLLDMTLAFCFQRNPLVFLFYSIGSNRYVKAEVSVGTAENLLCSIRKVDAKDAGKVSIYKHPLCYLPGKHRLMPVCQTPG